MTKAKTCRQSRKSNDLGHHGNIARKHSYNVASRRRNTQHKSWRTYNLEKHVLGFNKQHNSSDTGWVTALVGIDFNNVYTGITVLKLGYEILLHFRNVNNVSCRIPNM